MISSRAVRAAFLLSGVAGLSYEVLWSRYLGLYVGHGAYAQVLVLGVYLGGMAVGALAVSARSSQVRSPLRWYAGAELVLAAFGVAFHWLFVIATDVSYSAIFPAIGSASLVGSARWAIAGLLILPQAIVLGTTFPLMAAGLVRADPARPGGGVATAYLLNTLGGAAGVLIAGFWMIGRFGLPGTSVAAAVLNLAAAGLVLSSVKSGGAVPSDAARQAEGPVEASDAGAPGETEGAVEAFGAGAPATMPPPTLTSESESPGQMRPPRPEVQDPGLGLVGVLLTVAFGTAVASFFYEIGWIRMLALVLGSATHAFELMLSAFILGIAIGAWGIRRPADDSTEPVRLLGTIQVLMGVTAVLSLPLYLATFDLMATFTTLLPGRTAGYALYNVARYGICLLVMLPSTILAGATLPVLTATLLRAGAGERVIGRVYGINTVGSVTGAAVAGLIALPLIGLKGLIIAGASLDVGLGLWLLVRAGRRSGSGPRAVLVAAAASVIVFGAVTQATHFDPTTITSGVYRRGAVAEQSGWRSLYYADGRTATVSAHIGTSDGVIVLATNGKPDASIGPRWVLEERDTLPLLPIPQGRDMTTQLLAPIVSLAHRPQARSIANIGHGSGMTAVSFLTSSSLERLVTIEIEPLMVEGSLVFLPANGPAFADPRASYVFDDAKSFFAYRQERFDIVFAEPSNPWVSGTSSLFTREFYERVTEFMSEGGLLAQWMQLYELDDDLFLSVLSAVDGVFPYYRAYLIGDSDVAIVASREALAEPDWSVVENEAFAELTTSAPPFFPQHMDALLLFDQNTFRAILDSGVEPNSDFRPTLDLGAERTRFYQHSADGVYSFAVSRVDLTRHLSGRATERTGHQMVPAYGLASTILVERGAWLRDAVEAGGGIAPAEFPEWEEDLVHLQTFLLLTGSSTQLGSWETWASGFIRAENALHWGTTNWVDSTFYRNVDAFLERSEPPDEARAAVDLMRGYALGDWTMAAAAADRLTTRVAAGERWATPDLLLDIAVLAYIETGRAYAARNAIDLLAPATRRAPRDLRNRLLRALADLQ